jgi:uncharacterized membrane protein
MRSGQAHIWEFPMFIYLFPIGLTVLSNVFYHIFLKVTPGNANPLLALLVTYATAALTCLVFLPFFPPATSLSQSLKQLNWASVGLGVVIVGLELGFLLGYRVGWKISLLGIVSSSCVALILIPLGLAFFKEKISLVNMLGVLICIAGLIMISRK